MFFGVLLVYLVTWPFDNKFRIYPSRVFKLIGTLMLGINPFWRVHYINDQELKRENTKLLISNHQGFMDMPLQATRFIDFKWISKKSLFKIPIFGWAMALTRTVSVDRGKTKPGQMKRDIEPFLEAGIPICLYPEGTRTRDGQVKPFKNGAFVIARELNIPVRLMVLEGSYELLPPGDWRFNLDVDIFMSVLGEVHPQDFPDMESFRDYCHTIISTELARLRSVKKEMQNKTQA